jgi:hypothetical protein
VKQRDFGNQVFSNKVHRLQVVSIQSDCMDDNMVDIRLLPHVGH